MGEGLSEFRVRLICDEVWVERVLVLFFGEDSGS